MLLCAVFNDETAVPKLMRCDSSLDDKRWVVRMSSEIWWAIPFEWKLMANESTLIVIWPNVNEIRNEIYNYYWIQWLSLFATCTSDCQNHELAPIWNSIHKNLFTILLQSPSSNLLYSWCERKTKQNKMMRRKNRNSNGDIRILNKSTEC